MINFTSQQSVSPSPPFSVETNGSQTPANSMSVNLIWLQFVCNRLLNAATLQRGFFCPVAALTIGCERLSAVCHLHSPAPFSRVPGSVFACTVCRVEKRERERGRGGGENK